MVLFIALQLRYTFSLTFLPLLLIWCYFISTPNIIIPPFISWLMGSNVISKMITTCQLTPIRHWRYMKDMPPHFLTFLPILLIWSIRCLIDGRILWYTLHRVILWGHGQLTPIRHWRCMKICTSFSSFFLPTLPHPIWNSPLCVCQLGFDELYWFAISLSLLLPSTTRFSPIFHFFPFPFSIFFSFPFPFPIPLHPPPPFFCP